LRYRVIRVIGVFFLVTLVLRDEKKYIVSRTVTKTDINIEHVLILQIGSWGKGYPFERNDEILFHVAKFLK